MTRRTPPRCPKPQPGFAPTLTNEEIMKLPIFPHNTTKGRDYVVTDKGKAAIREGFKS